MPLTTTHLAFNYFIYLIVVFKSSLEFSYLALLFIALAELVDLDHLNKKPIYKKNRDSFKSHFFHKNWKLTLIVATPFAFVYPLTYTVLALYSHFLLDYLENKNI
ncbi:MAG: DUF6122 family protein [Candidatus Woesearchaeota archaeon]